MNTPAVRLGNTINVTEIVDNSPFTPLHWRSFTLCMACLVMDGFDVQVLGYTAPSIVRDWGVPAATLGPVFAAANFGVLLGALFISMLADRIGRRPVIVAAALFVGVMTILTGRVTSVPQLLVMRFLTGIGLGTIVSNASSLVGEYGLQADAGDADHVFGRRIHRRCGVRRLRRHGAHPRLRLAVGVLFWWRRTARHRLDHARRAARVAAVHGVARQESGEACDVAESGRSIGEGNAQR
jgi:hypothetical protein